MTGLMAIEMLALMALSNVGHRVPLHVGITNELLVYQLKWVHHTQNSTNPRHVAMAWSTSKPHKSELSDGYAYDIACMNVCV